MINWYSLSPIIRPWVRASPDLTIWRMEITSILLIPLGRHLQLKMEASWKDFDIFQLCKGCLWLYVVIKLGLAISLNICLGKGVGKY